MDLWFDQAIRPEPSSPGGQMDGSPPHAVIWHTTEGNTFTGNIAFLRQEGFEPHLVWDPITGQFAQFFPANVSARAVQNDGSIRTNRVGTVRFQIEVVGFAAHPFTDGPMLGRSALVAYLDSLGVPRHWPFGNPLPYPQSYGANGKRSESLYLSASGHMGHSNVPGNVHGDPGAISPAKITPVLPAPRPPSPVPTGKQADHVLISTQFKGVAAPSFWLLHDGKIVNQSASAVNRAVDLQIEDPADWARLQKVYGTAVTG